MPGVSGTVPSGDLAVDGLLSPRKWGGAAGAPVTLTFSFPDGGADWAPGYGDGQPAAGFRALDAGQRDAVRSVLAYVEEVTLLDFVEVAESGPGVGDLRFGISSVPPTAEAYYPSTSAEGGDVWFGQNYFLGEWRPGTYQYYTVIHEIGHALGLKHPHEADGGPPLPTSLDFIQRSVMSYANEPGGSPGYGLYFGPTTPMGLDVAALQYLYGADAGAAAGDTVYAWAPGARLLETIWDGGGRDTIDWSNRASDAVIRLEAGALSDLGPPYAWYSEGGGALPGTVAIARGALIEDARGGAGDDALVGNDLGNRLEGNGGDDELLGGGGDDALEGGAGDDRLDGGAGFDRATYAGAAAGVTVSLAAAAAQATGGAGRDTLAGIEALVGSAFDDALAGAAGDDTLVGGGGSDALDGGGGADDLRGGAGDDTLAGGAGSDALDGGPGLDTASYADAAAGVAVSLEPGGTRPTGGAGSDSLVGIEALVGSAFADALAGAEGDDGLAGGAGDDGLEGGAGDDALAGGNGDDGLRGDAGADALDGGGGADRLEGGAGLDRLVGGPGADVFVIAAGGRAEVVEDFADGLDRLAFRGFGAAFDTAREILAEARASGRDTLVSLPNGPAEGSTVLTLLGLDLAALDASDFGALVA